MSFNPQAALVKDSFEKTCRAPIHFRTSISFTYTDPDNRFGPIQNNGLEWVGELREVYLEIWKKDNDNKARLQGRWVSSAFSISWRVILF